MDTFINLITTLSFAIGVTGFACFAMLVVLYLRKERRQRTDWEKTEADKADIMLLFQTMRDVIGQQKNLAREFNQELERKMNLVKQILAKSMEKNERLYDKQQDLTRELEEARAELRSLQRQTGFLKENPPQAPAAPHISQPPSASAEPFVSLPTELDDEPDAPAEPDRFTGTGLTQAPAKDWSPQEFSGTPEASPVPPASEAVPSSSADGFREIIEGLTGTQASHESSDVYLEDEDPILEDEAPSESANEARNAFRSLLDMETPQSAASSTPTANGNNGGRSPIQSRVIEYHDAGMPVADIARELGIGKGEVRLMLSLAKQEKG